MTDPENRDLHYFQPYQSPLEREEVAPAMTEVLAQQLALSFRTAGLVVTVRNGAVVAQGPHEGD